MTEKRQSDWREASDSKRRKQEIKNGTSLLNYFAKVKPPVVNGAKKEESANEQALPECLINVKDVNPDSWRRINGWPGLNVDYAVVLSKSGADEIFQRLEREVVYYEGEYARVKVFNKWHNIPRKQVAYGDGGLTYAFSGNCIPAKPWTPLLLALRCLVESVSGYTFNFVLLNRYKDGDDYIGEHRDDEKDLVADAPIASMSLGQSRDFVFRHAARRKSAACPPSADVPPPVSVLLEHGSLLLMKSPTNDHWYHSLPKRKKAMHPRINLTFRRMVVK